MFKPTKKQHVINKAYADKNGGSGGGGTEPLIIRYDHKEVSGNIVTHYFDKTWQEVADALTNFTPVYIHGFRVEQEYTEFPLTVENIKGAYQEDGTFVVGWIDMTLKNKNLKADSADGALYIKVDIDK